MRLGRRGSRLSLPFRSGSWRGLSGTGRAWVWGVIRFSLFLNELIREQLLQIDGRGFAWIAFPVTNPRDGGLAATNSAGDGDIVPAFSSQFMNGVSCVHNLEFNASMH